MQHLIGALVWIIVTVLSKYILLADKRMKGGQHGGEKYNL